MAAASVYGWSALRSLPRVDLSFFTLATPAGTDVDADADLDAGSDAGSDGDGQVVLHPTPLACSSWGDDHLHGVAVAGALARSAEAVVTSLGRDDLTPARMTVDLFRPAAMAPCHLTHDVVREGPRICLVDVNLHQDGARVARASFLFLKASATAPGAVWSPDPAGRPVPPPEEVAPVSDEPRVPFVHSEAGWSQDFSEHQNASHKQSWNSAVPIVAGEPLTPFQAVAATADGASLVTNWGSGGVEHINTDITLALVRAPYGVEVGLSALDRVESDGIAVGTATVFDRAGALGTVVLTSISNAARAVDLAKAGFDDDGTRRSSRE